MSASPALATCYARLDEWEHFYTPYRRRGRGGEAALIAEDLYCAGMSLDSTIEASVAALRRDPTMEQSYGIVATLFRDYLVFFRTMIAPTVPKVDQAAFCAANATNATWKRLVATSAMADVSAVNPALTRMKAIVVQFAKDAKERRDNDASKRRHGVHDVDCRRAIEALRAVRAHVEKAVKLLDAVAAQYTWQRDDIYYRKHELTAHVDPVLAAFPALLSSIGSVDNVAVDTAVCGHGIAPDHDAAFLRSVVTCKMLGEMKQVLDKATTRAAYVAALAAKVHERVEQRNRQQNHLKIHTFGSQATGSFAVLWYTHWLRQCEQALRAWSERLEYDRVLPSEMSKVSPIRELSASAENFRDSLSVIHADVVATALQSLFVDYFDEATRIDHVQAEINMLVKQYEMETARDSNDRAYQPNVILDTCRAQMYDEYSHTRAERADAVREWENARAQGCDHAANGTEHRQELTTCMRTLAISLSDYRDNALMRITESESSLAWPVRVPLQIPVATLEAIPLPPVASVSVPQQGGRRSLLVMLNEWLGEYWDELRRRHATEVGVAAAGVETPMEA